MSLKCHSVSVVVCFNFSLLLGVSFLWIGNPAPLLTETIMCLSVREQRVIQALAVCSTLKPLIWLAWMQSVSSPTYGTAEDTETVLEQTSSAAGGGVTQGKSCLSSWHLSRQTHYLPAGCSIQNHCEVRKKINYWRVCNQGNNRKSKSFTKTEKTHKVMIDSARLPQQQ